MCYQTSLLGSCGLGSLSHFTYAPSKFTDWQDEAEWLSAIYRALYTPGQVLYCLTDVQAQSSVAHQALLKLGAKQIDDFPNIFHGPRTLKVFRVNVRNACGRFCNQYGEAYSEPPKDDSEVLPEQTEPQAANPYQYLPIKPPGVV